MKKFVYITTPIYYVNDIPHIGHAYTTILADVLIRYNRLFGHNCFFLTGTDEHGQKVEQAAKKRGKDPKAHCDEMSQNFKNVWNELNISYDRFIRTTDPEHQRVVKSCLQVLYDQGEIYAKDYEGWYAQGEEVFYTEKELIDGKTPMGHEVVKIVERNYFFKMSSYQNKLIAHIEKNPHYIEPQSRKNEILGFLKKPLQDLCISRPKSRLTWGIELPFDSDYVTYVWFDALLNYAAAVGLGDGQRKNEFDQWWIQTSGPIHLVGKDIITTHAVYWSTMLMALGLNLPKMIYAHGWWLTSSNEKMSKSKGEVVRPLDLKDTVGVEPLRYFLMRDMVMGQDAPFSKELLEARINAELSNNLGNLLNRTCNLIDKYFSSKAPESFQYSEQEKAIVDQVLSLYEKVKNNINELSVQKALVEIKEALTTFNQYVDQQAPWKLAKVDLKQAGHVLKFVLDGLSHIAFLLCPVMPKKMKDLLERISIHDVACMAYPATSYETVKAGALIQKGEVLFPKLMDT